VHCAVEPRFCRPFATFPPTENGRPSRPQPSEQRRRPARSVGSRRRQFAPDTCGVKDKASRAPRSPDGSMPSEAGGQTTDDVALATTRRATPSPIRCSGNLRPMRPKRLLQAVKSFDIKGLFLDANQKHLRPTCVQRKHFASKTVGSRDSETTQEASAGPRGECGIEVTITRTARYIYRKGREGSQRHQSNTSATRRRPLRFDASDLLEVGNGIVPNRPRGTGVVLIGAGIVGNVDDRQRRPVPGAASLSVIVCLVARTGRRRRRDGSGCQRLAMPGRGNVRRRSWASRSGCACAPTA